MTRPRLNLDQLRAFAAVADHRSFTRAAVGLHRTQSAVSLQVKRLEATLGVALFERRARGVEPTAAGLQLLVFAREMLALDHRAVDEVGGGSASRPVRLGVMEDFGALVAARLASEFAARTPGASVELHTGLTGPMLGRLGADFDLVIAMHPLGDGRGHLLRRERAVWAVGPMCRVTASDVMPLALYAPGCLLREWAIAALDAAGRRWALQFVGQSIASVHAAVADGQTLTVAKSGMFPRSLRRAPPELALPRLPAAEVRLHRAAGLSRTARGLADHLVAGVQHTSRSTPPVLRA